MLFRKDIEPRCIYCSRGRPISGEEIACRRHGIMSVDDRCGHFRYDPRRRIPPVPAPLKTERLSAADFALEED